MSADALSPDFTLLQPFLFPNRVFTAFAHVCAVINSRLAMLGCVAAITAELTTQTTVFEQV
jgi:Chlorophyll A-B binding protein